jgi:hypothetical protein
MSNYNYEAFYTPELTINTPDGEHNLRMIYNAFITRFSDSLETIPEQEYFFHFAMHCDANRYYYERKYGKFSYKPLCHQSVSDDDVHTMKEFILYHAKDDFFTMLEGTMFYEFIAPFMPEYPQIELLDDDDEDLPDDYTIVFNETKRPHSPSEYY